MPNLVNDIHDGTVAQGGAWIKTHVDGYVQWAKRHKSLFIFTLDKDNRSDNNDSLPFFIGQHAKKGSPNERLTTP